jgi:hypothetical protein
VLLLKCLLLQQWYWLSDPVLEEALLDRLSFRRFVGLALADPVPDHSTLSRFRGELVRRGLAERLLPVPAPSRNKLQPNSKLSAAARTLSHDPEPGGRLLHTRL